jgi:hypothetical protein
MRTTLLDLLFVVGALTACGGSDRTNPTPDPDAQVPSDGATGDAIDAPPPTGKLCGGFSGVMCAANEYCDYPDNHCGIADGAGTCTRRPDACPALIGRPVCGCDDRVHSSDCIAYSDGVDLNADGCTVPTGSFACGYAVCSLATQYCRRDTKPADGDVYTCVMLPQGCPAGAPTCECLRAEPCGLSCAGNEKIGLTVTCQ